MKVTHIKLSFSNAYLITDRKSILVDAGMPGEEDKVVLAVTQAGVRMEELSLILHTHGHVDHAGATAALKRRYNTPTAVHANDAFMLKQGISGPVKPRNLEARLVKAAVGNGAFPPVEPDVILTQEMSLRDYGVDADVLFTPGHTKGSLSVRAGDALIVGDLMMGGWLGGALFGETPNYHYFIDDLVDVRASMERILALHPSTIYVGHGGPLRGSAAAHRFI